MDSLKNFYNTIIQSSRNLSSNHYSFTILFTLILLFLFLSASDNTSQLQSPPLNLQSPAALIPTARFASDNYRSCTDHSASLSSRNGAMSLSRMDPSDSTCDLFDGHWVVNKVLDPLYRPGSCPFVDDSFNCFKNGRPDSDYLKLVWKPHGCEIPRFDGLKMLKILKGKRMVFVGDSLNRNMWESLVCALRESLANKNRVFEVSGRQQFRNQGFYSFKFKDFNCSIDFIKSPYLVQEWKFSDKAGTRRETLRLDMMESSFDKYNDADVIIFNTGHWWTHQKTFKRNYYFQEGNHVYNKLQVEDAYKKALKTWARWVDLNIDSSRTMVFFRGYSASHFKGGQWNSGGSCDGEMRPITNETQLGPYPWMMRALESVLLEMKTNVFYLNISKMTDYRKEGHPSIFRQSAVKRRPGMIQDCSHWCLPGVPDSWNEILLRNICFDNFVDGNSGNSPDWIGTRVNIVHSGTTTAAVSRIIIIIHLKYFRNNNKN
ncbi:hypothetical protein ACJIZ3_013561 [Penstemon smallii]|uniref:Trichome birefringence-like N-terminal domain-containing protein n=1 Tax=Penstemon smallii TaxID=265156 RepID=A0ABD3RHC8_9LAMI